MSSKGPVSFSPPKGKPLSVGIYIEFLEPTLKLIPIWREIKNWEGEETPLFLLLPEIFETDAQLENGKKCLDWGRGAPDGDRPCQLPLGASSLAGVLWAASYKEKVDEQ